MAKKTYIGIGGVARNVKKNYIGIGGVARNVTKAYVGVSGVARQYFGSGIGSLPEGSIIQLNENGVPAQFYIAKHDYESELNGTGRTLLVRRYSLTASSQWGTRNSVYKGSVIDTYFEETYLPVLDAAVKIAIGTTQIYSQGTAISCSVFAPSLTELGLLDKVSSSYISNIKAEGTELPVASIFATPESSSPNGSGDIFNAGYPRRKSYWTRTYYNRYPFNVDASVAPDVIVERKENPYGRSGYLPAFTLPADFIIPE